MKEGLGKFQVLLFLPKIQVYIINTIEWMKHTRNASSIAPELGAERR